MPFLPPEVSPFAHFTRRLDEAGVPYVVTGSIAAMAYGQARFTNDIDLVAWLDLPAAARLGRLFPAGEFYCPPFDILAIEITRERRGHFNILHIESGYKADVYLRGNDPLHAWALAGARRVIIGELTVPLAPPEYVIVRKLEYFREGGSEKHLRDIRLMLQFSPQEIDTEVLMGYIKERSLEQAWQHAQNVPL